jgi:hypothetical protein
VPAEYAFDQAEYATGVTAGEQDREPGHVARALTMLIEQVNNEPPVMPGDTRPSPTGSTPNLAFNSPHSLRRI